ncbi:hypothetical protein ACTXJW_20705 [Hafnia alvei]
MEKQLNLFTPELPLPAQRTIKRALSLLAHETLFSGTISHTESS